MTTNENRTIVKVGEEITFGPKIRMDSDAVEFVPELDTHFEEVSRSVRPVEEGNFIGCRFELTVRAKNTGDCDVPVDIRTDGDSIASANYSFRITAG